MRTASSARRRDPLELTAVAASTRGAMQQAGIEHDDVDLFELHDAYTIMTTLTLEAAGFASAGTGLDYADAERIGLNGELPLTTFGGLKARGHPVGATGMYQIVETIQQLRGECGATQVDGAKVGMAQNIGGSGATILTHILKSD